MDRASVVESKLSSVVKLVVVVSVVLVTALAVGVLILRGHSRPESIDQAGGTRIIMRVKPPREGRAAGDVAALTDLSVLRGALESRVNAVVGGRASVRTQGQDLVVDVAGSLSPDEMVQIKNTISLRGELTMRYVPELDNGTWTTAMHTGSDGNDLPYEEIFDRNNGKPVTDEDLQKRVFSHKPLLSGSQLMHNSVPLVSSGGAVVSFEFMDGPEGKGRFEDFTRTSAGRRLAIFLDRRLLSAPTIQGVIPGKGVIEGRFKPSQAKRLAVLLNSRPLPAAVEIVETQTVTPRR